MVSGFIPFCSFLIASSSFSILCENRPRIERQQGLDQPHGIALKVQANTETNSRNSSNSRNLKLKLLRIALEISAAGTPNLAHCSNFRLRACETVNSSLTCPTNRHGAHLSHFRRSAACFRALSNAQKLQGTSLPPCAKLSWAEQHNYVQDSTLEENRNRPHGNESLRHPSNSHGPSQMVQDLCERSVKSRLRTTSRVSWTGGLRKERAHTLKRRHQHTRLAPSSSKLLERRRGALHAKSDSARTP